jgi:hypothetical protein
LRLVVVLVAHLGLVVYLAMMVVLEVIQLPTFLPQLLVALNIQLLLVVNLAHRLRFLVQL